MWVKQPHLLHPLTVFASSKVKFKWADVEQKAFNEIKRMVACNKLLIYTDLKKRFDSHTDASDLQL